MPKLPPRVKKSLLALAGVSVVLLAALAGFAWYCDWSTRATPAERARAVPGDELIPRPLASLNHAITIRRPPLQVWPWLAQMGSDRAGWYAYDFIDNGGRPSATRLLPQFQDVRAGTIFPALPGVRDAFVVAACDPPHSLILSWRLPSGTYLTTWSFLLEESVPGQTRLLVRGRAAPGYTPFGLPEWLAKALAPWAHAIMQRKQLLGLQRRAESGP